MFKRIKHWWNGSDESIVSKDGQSIRYVTLPNEFDQPWIRRFFRSHRKRIIGFFTLLVSALFGVAYYFKDAINQYIITKFM